MICILIDGVGAKLRLEYKIQSYIFILDRLNKYYIHTLYDLTILYSLYL